MRNGPLRRVVAVVIALAVLLPVAADGAGAENVPTTESPSSPLINARAWPEATARFHADDPCWWSADGAYSVPLGNDRFLFTFGDSLVFRDCVPGQEWRFLHNTIAIQTGSNPETATMDFHWPADPVTNEPNEMFDTGTDGWYWPIDGIVVNGKLLVALAHISYRDGVPPPWNFGQDYNDVAIIDNPTADVSDWTPSYVQLPTGPLQADGTRMYIEHRAFLRHGDYLYSYVTGAQGAAYLRRFALADVVVNDFSSPEWFAGPAGWFGQDELGVAAPVFTGSTPQFSIHEQFGLFVETHGIFNGHIELRFARSPEGPFTAPRPIYLPPEPAQGHMTYVGISHVGMTGADMVLTYSTNGSNIFQTAFHPRFVHVDVADGFEQTLAALPAPVPRL